MPKKEKQGFGITECEVTVYDGNDTADDLLFWDAYETAGVGPSGNKAVERVANEVDNVIRWLLDIHGEPWEYREIKEPIFTAPQRLLQVKCTPDSAGHYAKRLFSELTSARNNLKQGDKDAVMLRFYRLGKITAEARIKFKHEPTWEIGRRKQNSFPNAPTVSDDDIRAVVNDPTYHTRDKQAKRLGISVRQLLRRIAKLK